MSFVNLLLSGPSLVTSVAGGAALCAAGATTLYALRRKIPHPTEYSFIGCCFLRGGCHKHPQFLLVVEVHEVKNVAVGSPVYVYIECGRFDSKTHESFVERNMHVAVFETLKITVRQKDNILRICLYRKGTIKSTLLGELDLKVVEDIIDEDYPQLRWYNLKKDEKNTSKICISFHRMESDIDVNDSPLVRQAIINANREAASKGCKFDKSYDDMSDQEKLAFLSGVLEGPLKVMKFKGWIDYYFKAIQKKGRWSWAYWHSKEDMQKDLEPICKIPLLSISLVLPDSNDRKQLYVKYHTKDGPQDLFLRRVDRDRDIWSNGLYEFIERVKKHMFHALKEQKHAPKIPKQKLDESNKKSSVSFKKDTEVKPTTEDVKSDTVVKTTSESNLPRLPESVAKMIRDSKKKTVSGFNDYSLSAANTNNSIKEIFEGMRTLKYHERKLLKKVNFFDWKRDRNERELKILRRYGIEDREEYAKYNRLCGNIKNLVSMLRELPENDSKRSMMTNKLIRKLSLMGIVQPHAGLADLEKLAASTFCRRRLTTVLTRLHFAENIEHAISTVKHGHIRIGPKIVTNPSVHITKEMEDHITWAEGSSIKRKICEFRDEVDDYELLGN